MKILLIFPSRSRRNTYSSSNTRLQDFFDTNQRVPSFYLPSLSLLTIAACTPKDIEVKLIDERVSRIDFEEHADLVGISIMTEQAMRGYEIAFEFKKRGVPTVMGGIHASILPEEAATHCDSVVIGEGESLWPQILKDFQKRSLRRFYTNDCQVDIMQSPVPRYDLLDMDAYNLIPTQTTRGCPHDCSFCTATKVYGPRFRSKTLKQVIDEVEAIQRASQKHRIVFNDDNMFVDRRKSYQLLSELIPLKIKYFTESDASIAEDEKLLDLMQKSGCVTVFIGFESLVPENLTSLQNNQWKFKRLATYSKVCQKIQSYGIQVLGAFIVGFDHDDKSVFQQLIDFTLENNILGQYHFLTPFPGTRLRSSLIQERRLKADYVQWDTYSCFDVVFDPLKMSREDLFEGLLHVYQTVYGQEAHVRRSRHMIDIFKRLRHHHA
ncbi:MAG: radical SAM protein [bacterium]